MAEPCGRAGQVDIMSYVDNPGSPEWQEFRSHERDCPTCRAIVQGWAVIAEILRDIEKQISSPHPKESDLVDYHRRPDTLPAVVHASIAQHLQNCAACNADLRFIDSFTFTSPEPEQADAEQLRDDAVPAKPLWRASVADMGEVFELTSTLVIELGKLAAAFTKVPTGLNATPYSTPTPVMRGAATEVKGNPIGSPGQSVKFTLGDSEIGVELAVEREPTDHLLLRVLVEGGSPIQVAFSLRQQVGAQSRLVAAQSTADIEPFVVERLAAGEYSLQVWEIGLRHRFQMRLQVTPSTHL